MYQDCAATGEAEEPGQHLRWWDSRTGLDKPWTTIDADGITGLDVSPDGGGIVYGRIKELSSLMMIENFR
jgi:hypothetical protein